MAARRSTDAGKIARISRVVSPLLKLPSTQPHAPSCAQRTHTRVLHAHGGGCRGRHAETTPGGRRAFARGRDQANHPTGKYWPLGRTALPQFRNRAQTARRARHDTAWGRRSTNQRMLTRATPVLTQSDRLTTVPARSVCHYVTASPRPASLIPTRGNPTAQPLRTAPCIALSPAHAAATGGTTMPQPSRLRSRTPPTPIPPHAPPTRCQTSLRHDFPHTHTLTLRFCCGPIDRHAWWYLDSEPWRDTSTPFTGTFHHA
jgi:hypothetical protein